ncbi:MAG: Lrp/AsnC family transcriptional regulator, regulator for asnA, asnC and gidA, partial [Actinomycetota bacterium]|nr:Lrp/AsnC family transcriptional regulator, regulator for asnA, asnC and gidA [Actinomycetota bacterium]
SSDRGADALRVVQASGGCTTSTGTVVVCEDDDGLLELLNNKIRAVPGVVSTDAFTYLKTCKETYTWGTR